MSKNRILFALVVVSLFVVSLAGFAAAYDEWVVVTQGTYVLPESGGDNTFEHEYRRDEDGVPNGIHRYLPDQNNDGHVEFGTWVYMNGCDSQVTIKAYGIIGAALYYSADSVLTEEERLDSVNGPWKVSVANVTDSILDNDTITIEKPVKYVYGSCVSGVGGTREVLLVVFPRPGDVLPFGVQQDS